MKKVLKWIWLAEKCGAASTEISNLLENFDGINEIYLADYDTLTERGCSVRLAEKLADKGLDKVYAIVDDCEKNGIEYTSSTWTS